MKKKIVKKIIFMTFFALAIWGFSNSVDAAYISLNTSKSVGTPGENIAVNISSDCVGRINISVSNGTVSSDKVWIEGGSQPVTVKLGASGTTTITATAEGGKMSNNGVDVDVATVSKNVSIISNSSSVDSSSNSGTSNNVGNNTSTTQTKSNNANVKMITTSPVDFTGFKTSKTSGYEVAVENNVDRINVNVTKENSNASVSLLNKTNSDTGKSWVYIAEGSNEIAVTVTSEDGTNQKIYTINVTRKTKEEQTEEPQKPEENSEEEPMEEAFGLTKLNIEGLELEPQFQTDIYEYKVELKEDLEKLKIETLATKANSDIEITGNENLQEGENIITIIVKGENEAETATYQIIVNKTLEKQEDIINQEQDHQQMMKKIIVLSVAGGLIFIIVIVVVIVKIKKSRKSSGGYIPYENLIDDYDYNEEQTTIEDVEENEELEEQAIEDDEEDEFYDEEPRKKKHSKGKRFK